jgi:hypothetical protein
MKWNSIDTFCISRFVGLNNYYTAVTHSITIHNLLNNHFIRALTCDTWEKIELVTRKKERIPRLPAALRYRVLSRDSFKSSIFFLQILLVVALDRRPARRRVPVLNHLSFPYTLTSHKDQYMSHVISMRRPGDPRQAAVSDLSKVILYLVAPRFDFGSTYQTT